MIDNYMYLVKHEDGYEIKSHDFALAFWGKYKLEKLEKIADDFGHAETDQLMVIKIKR